MRLYIWCAQPRLTINRLSVAPPYDKIKGEVAPKLADSPRVDQFEGSQDASLLEWLGGIARVVNGDTTE